MSKLVCVLPNQSVIVLVISSLEKRSSLQQQRLAALGHLKIQDRDEDYIRSVLENARILSFRGEKIVIEYGLSVLMDLVA